MRKTYQRCFDQSDLDINQRSLWTCEGRVSTPPLVSQPSMRGIASEFIVKHTVEHVDCWRRLNFDHLCRLNFDQGLLLT